MLLASVTNALDAYVRDAHPKELFGGLLDDLLRLTGSGYGYIAEVVHEPDGVPFLRTWAITNIAWDDETRALYDEHVTHGGGLEFRNLETLFGWGLLEGGRVVISSDPASDPRASGRPGGHPPLDSFLGMPVFRGGVLIGQLGVANRPGGYDDALVEFLRPFASAVGNLIDAYRADAERRDALAALERSEQWYAAVLANLSDIVTVFDEDLAWVYSSAAGERVLGYPRGYDPAGGIYDLLHPADVPVASAALAEVLAGTRGPDDAVELRVLDLEGDVRVFETTGEDLRDHPAVRGVVLTSHDVTERRLAETRLREISMQLTTLVAYLRDAVLLVDGDRCVRWVNPVFLRLFGLDGAPASFVGLPAPDLPVDYAALVEDPDEFRIRIEEVYAAPEPIQDEEIRFTGGRVVARDHVAVPLGAGEPGHLWVYRDITAAHDLERERARALRREREARARTEERNRELAELAEMKNEFVASVSHELRTPLTSIVGFTELLADCAPELTDESREYVEAIERNTTRLVRLVNDLLLLGRLESGTLAFEPADFDVAGVVCDSLADVAEAAARAGVTLTADAPAPLVLHGDRGRIAQVVDNLVANAVKYSAAGGNVRVGVRSEGTEAVVEVRDEGIGIPADEQAHLFDRFFRASNARGAGIPGTGLGLMISSVIVERHGGTITLASAPGVGTVVTVRLPVAGPATGVAA